MYGKHTTEKSNVKKKITPLRGLHYAIAVIVVTDWVHVASEYIASETAGSVVPLVQYAGVKSVVPYAPTFHANAVAVSYFGLRVYVTESAPVKVYVAGRSNNTVPAVAPNGAVAEYPVSASTAVCVLDGKCRVIFGILWHILLN